MHENILSAALVIALSALLWSPVKVSAQAPALPTASASVKKQPSLGDTYLQGYLVMRDGDKLRTAKDFVGAYYKYRDARDTFDAVQVADPSWNSEILDYRRRKIRESMEEVRREEIRRRVGDGESSPQEHNAAGTKITDAPANFPPDAPAVDPLSPPALLTNGPHSLLEAIGAEGGVRPSNNGASIAPLTTPPPETTDTPPAIAATSLDGDQFSVRFTTLAGFSYQLESSSDLNGWTPLGDAVRGDGAEKSISTTVTGTGRWFFRISRLP